MVSAAACWALIASGCASGAPPAAGGWSTPATLAACSQEAPSVVFPSSAPDQASGRGAVVWEVGGSCTGGAGARLAPLGPGDVPAAPRIPRAAGGARLAPLAPLTAAAAPHGEIALGGGDPRHAGAALAVQGRAAGPFSPIAGAPAGGAPVAAADGWLGDLALESLGHAGLIVAVERFFSHTLAPRGGDPMASGAAAPVVTLDYRSDALAAWVRAGGVYVRDMPAKGAMRAPQRLGPASPRTHVAALLSDDDRAIVMWATSRGGATDVYLALSAPGPRFGPPRLVERFADPQGVPPPGGSPLLVRLSSEGVVAAWAGTAGGRWVVRTAPIDEHGLRTVSAIAAPGTGQALVRALAAGPRGEAILLLAAPTGTGGGLLAARGYDEAPGRTVFAAPEQVAPAPAPAAAAVAVDPADDRPVAAWRDASGAVEYSLGPAPSGG